MTRVDMIPHDGRPQRLAREVEAAARRVAERGRATVIDGREGMVLGALGLVNLEAGVALLAPGPGGLAAGGQLTYTLDQDGEAARGFRAKVCDLEVW